MLEISPSGLHVSSSWLPPRLDALIREGPPGIGQGDNEPHASTWGGSVEPISPVRQDTQADSEGNHSEDRSSGLAVVEADVGGVNGEASLEIVQGLLLVLAAHKAKKAALSTIPDEDTDNVSEFGKPHRSLQAYSPPTLAVVLESGRCGYRIFGPSVPFRASFGHGEDDADLVPGFSAPSLLCVHVMSLAVTLHTRYADVPIHRTEAQRRELRQEIMRGSIFVPNVLFRGSQSQRASEQRAKEARKRMFDSPQPGEDLEEWSISTSPVSTDKPTQVPVTAPPQSVRDKSAEGFPLTASHYKENDFLCFITPDDGRMPDYARRIARSHAGGHKEVLEHPFVYFVDTSVRLQKIDVYLLSSSDSQARRDPRSNPTSARSDRFNRSSPTSEHNIPKRSSTSPPTVTSQAKRHSRPATSKRHDILSIDFIETIAALEILGREISVGEHSLAEPVFLSSIDSEDTIGSVSFICDGPRSEISNLDVHHCLSSVLHLTTNIPPVDIADDAETLASSTGFSKSEDNDPTPVNLPRSSPPPMPLAQLLPPNIHFSVGVVNIEMFIAGPDPKYMPNTCRGLALRVAQLTLQRYRQDRYVVSQSHAHVRAPLGLPPDLRAHAQSVFNETKQADQAFVTLQIRSVRVNPLKDSGKENRVMRAKPPIDSHGRSTTGNVDFEFVEGWKWCKLPRGHFYPAQGPVDTGTETLPPKSEQRTPHKVSKRSVRFAAASVRDFFFVEEIDVRVTFWTKPATAARADRKESLFMHSNSDQSHTTQFQDCIGLAIRVPHILIRSEVFQVYCFLLAFSVIRSLLPSNPSAHKRQPSRLQKPHLQLKCSVSQIHLYWTLPHSVKLYSCLRRIEISSRKNDVQLELESGVVAGESHSNVGVWEDIIRIRKWALILKEDQESLVRMERTFILKGDGARLRIPYKYPFSEIVDNLVTFVKLIKQLSHQFVKGKWSSAIEPRAEPPKRVPAIRIDMKILVLEAADDPFEARLNLAWNAGKTEQLHRLAREKLFEFEAAAHDVRDKGDNSGAQTQAYTRRSSENDGSQDKGSFTSACPVDPATQARGEIPHSHSKHAPLAKLRERFHKANSTQWIKIIRDAQSQRTREEDKHVKDLYGHIRNVDGDLPVQLLDHHGHTPLMRLVFKAIDVRLSKPSFSNSGEGLRDYMYNVGKGIPQETQYSLNIPFHLDWKMNEAKAHVRDYPIPLLDIPSFIDNSRTADENTQSWHLATDFVIAEELSGSNSIRHVSAVIVPAEYNGTRQSSQGYYFRVPRTAMPVKFYATPVITIHSDSATRLSWGNSVQPAIQDVMRVMDSLTKPPPDPSERLGFWDKIRLILHWRIAINFKGKGPLHLILKGSRDPYSVQGIGAGFALSWHDDIRWRIGFDNEDGEFFQIFSDRFVLGVPGASSSCLVHCY